MKRYFYKVILFFKKDHWTKHLSQILLYAALLGVFSIFFLADAITNALSTVFAFLFSALILYSGKVFISYFEDLAKVSCDTDQMLKIYKKGNYKKTLKIGDSTVTFAYAPSLENEGYTFHVEDAPDKFFQLDEFIEGNFPLIFSAHSNSTKNNGTTIRLDDFKLEDNKCTFYTSRSTTFNHLVTNRAIDFFLFDDVSLRSMFEYGPVLRPYKESKMSNHIGINALVFLSDGRLLVPHRKKDSTISKNKITSSIAVKLDFPEGRTDIDAEHLMQGTIYDNLDSRCHIPAEDLDRSQVEITFLGFGQNVYEGGKPQFYYSVKLTDVDTDKYFELSRKWEEAHWEDKHTKKLDVDKCIHVADLDSFEFHRGKVTFTVHAPENKETQYTLGYEMSYLCNLWHLLGEASSD